MNRGHVFYVITVCVRQFRKRKVRLFISAILEEAEREPEKNFLLLVPEQFTMQTQRELVQRQRNHAIMNVDVLSFVRLAYRVFDDLGMQDLSF